jgi:hypothetical protein
VGPLAKKKVSLQVQNMDVDDVVRLLAAAGGMRTYRLDNVFLVTTKRHWEEVQDREPGRERSFAAPP